MYQGLRMSATVRKNFVFSEEIAIHLAELAKKEGASMTSFLETLIEEKYGSMKVAKRVEAFNRSIEIAQSIGTGLFADQSIQSIKAEKDV